VLKLIYGNVKFQIFFPEEVPGARLKGKGGKGERGRDGEVASS
jgi:hypothetical protein